MGFFKVLMYVSAGLGAVVLAPVTGGGSLAVAIGAMGTTTAAGAAIGAAVGAAAAGLDHAVTSDVETREEGRKEGIKEGTKAAEAIFQEKYKERVEQLSNRLRGYQNYENKLIGMYAIGLAVAKTDGYISAAERNELDEFVCGCMVSKLPLNIKNKISKMAAEPPDFKEALEFAKKYEVPKRDITDVIYLVANADGTVNAHEQSFIRRWESLSDQYEYV